MKLKIHYSYLNVDDEVTIPGFDGRDIRIKFDKLLEQRGITIEDLDYFWSEEIKD